MSWSLLNSFIQLHVALLIYHMTWLYWVPGNKRSVISASLEINQICHPPVIIFFPFQLQNILCARFKVTGTFIFILEGVKSTKILSTCNLKGGSWNWGIFAYRENSFCRSIYRLAKLCPPDMGRLHRILWPVLEVFFLLALYLGVIASSVVRVHTDGWTNRQVRHDTLL